eukprot:g401.t1
MSGFLQGLDDSQEKSIESLWRNISEWKAELETKVGSSSVLENASLAEENSNTKPSKTIPPATDKTILAEVQNYPWTRSYLLRFLRARSFDVDKALALIKCSFERRAGVGPFTLQSKDFPNATESGCWKLLGFSIAGQPIILVRARLWRPSQYYGVAEYERYITYFSQLAAKLMGPGVERMHVIFDLKDFSRDMMTIRALKCLNKLVTIVQDLYPETLGKAFLVNANWIFQTAWAIIKDWIDPVTIAKVVFLGTDYESSLRKYIADTTLPESLGGKRSEDLPEDIPSGNINEMAKTFLESKVSPQVEAMYPDRPDLLRSITRDESEPYICKPNGGSSKTIAVPVPISLVGKTITYKVVKSTTNIKMGVAYKTFPYAANRSNKRLKFGESAGEEDSENESASVASSSGSSTETTSTSTPTVTQITEDGNEDIDTENLPCGKYSPRSCGELVFTFENGNYFQQEIAITVAIVDEEVSKTK